ncbi:hypothetical protein Q9888_002742 [Vibrio cholerae]|nr:hypothetical protein [Vibrio cholerae]
MHKVYRLERHFKKLELLYEAELAKSKSSNANLLFIRFEKLERIRNRLNERFLCLTGGAYYRDFSISVENLSINLCQIIEYKFEFES